MDEQYLTLSKEIRKFVDYALADGMLQEEEVKLLRRKAAEFGDDPDEVEMVARTLLYNKNNPVPTITETESYEEFVEVKPVYNLFNSVQRAILKYKDFTGRASRAEFWYFILFNYIFILLISSLITANSEQMDQNEGIKAIIGLFLIFYYLVIITPLLSLWVRRLHDIGKSGKNLFIPGYNIFCLFIAGTRGENAYGEDPYALVSKKLTEEINTRYKSIKPATIETIGGTLIAVSATIQKLLSFEWISFDQMGAFNRYIWLLGTVLLVAPRVLKILQKLKK